MKSAVRTRGGLPADLTIKEIDMPVPKNNEILKLIEPSKIQNIAICIFNFKST